MKTMATEAVGTILLSVHTADPPDQAAWNKYLAEMSAMLDRVGVDRMRNLIFTEGGGPSFAQRQQVREILKGRAVLGAVISSNAFVRGIVTALAIFNPKIKVFRPDAAAEAFRYLGISEIDGKAVWRAAARLQTQLG